MSIFLSTLPNLSTHFLTYYFPGNQVESKVPKRVDRVDKMDKFWLLFYKPQFRVSQNTSHSRFGSRACKGKRSVAALSHSR